MVDWSDWLWVNVRNKGEFVDGVAVWGDFSEFFWTEFTGFTGFLFGHREIVQHRDTEGTENCRVVLGLEEGRNGILVR